MEGLTRVEIAKIVNQYIGVTNGYLGDFSYRTHADFYPDYCNLEIDPSQYPGTTRERFIEILDHAAADVQAKILRGVLQKFPLEAEHKPATRTRLLQEEIASIVARLESASPVAGQVPKTTSAVVERAIRDVEALLQANGAISGVDRVHTALHGYLRAICDRDGISYTKDDTLAKLFKLLRQNHPAFNNKTTHTQEINRILQSFATVMDALSPIRNSASVAHPNETLLGNDEAMLVINVARTLLNYLDAKFH